MNIGYITSESVLYNLEEGKKLLVKNGVKSSDIVVEEMFPRTLQTVISQLSKGDTLIIIELADICTSIKKLLALTHDIESKGAFVKSLSQSWFDTSETNSNARNMVTILEELNNFNMSLTRKLTIKGLEKARAIGNIGGRPMGASNRTKSRIEKAKRLYATGKYSLTDISKKVGCPRSTLYRYMRKNGEVKSV